MPRRGVSGTRGLYKKHIPQCTNDGDPSRCQCPWWGKYKGVTKSLAKWSGQQVDPFRKAHAVTVLNRFKVAIDSGRFSPKGERQSLGSKQTFRQFIDEWREHYMKVRRLRSSSIEPKLRLIERGLGSYTLEQLAGASLEIERWLNECQRERGWCDNTWNRYYQMLSTLFVRATKWRSGNIARISVNPMTAIERRVGCTRKFRVRLEEDVEDRLFAACDLLDRPTFTHGFKLDWDKVAAIRERLAAGQRQLDVARAFGISPTTCCQIANGDIWNPENYKTPRTGYMMRLRLMAAFDAGVRREEMMRIQLKHINFTPIHVEVDGRLRELLVVDVQSKGEKTTGEKEVVYIGTTRLIEALRRRREELNDEPNAYVFGTVEGWRQQHFRQTWHRLFALAKLEFGRDKGLVWHTLRHEFCSRTAENTGDPVVAQELARHKDLRTTQGYLHARRSRVLAAAVALDRSNGDPRSSAGTRGQVTSCP
jgi:integrase